MLLYQVLRNQIKNLGKMKTKTMFENVKNWFGISSMSFKKVFQRIILITIF